MYEQHSIHVEVYDEWVRARLSPAKWAGFDHHIAFIRDGGMTRDGAIRDVLARVADAIIAQADHQPIEVDTATGRIANLCPHPTCMAGADSVRRTGETEYGPAYHCLACGTGWIAP